MEATDEYYNEMGKLLEECDIVDLTISPLSFQVSFVLKDAEIHQFYRLTFADVRNFMWFTQDTTANVYPCFTTINNGITPITSSDHWLKQFRISFNTTIEIEELAVLIGAGSIRLEEQDEAGNVGRTILAFACDTDDAQDNADGSEPSAKAGLGFWKWLKGKLAASRNTQRGAAAKEESTPPSEG